MPILIRERPKSRAKIERLGLHPVFGKHGTIAVVLDPQGQEHLVSDGLLAADAEDESLKGAGRICKGRQ
jgi:hypothetical protein